jgi:ribosome-associated protein
MRKACNFCDYFLIASANSSIHIKAIAEAIEESLKDEGIKPFFPSKEQIDSGWVVLDYGSVIAHIFYQPLRKFYSLENLWHSARKVKIPLKDHPK